MNAFEEPDRFDEEPVTGQDEPAYRDPVISLLIEYRRVATSLWLELSRHQAGHGCVHPDDCPLRRTLVDAWCETERMADALDFVALGEVPYSYRFTGIDGRGWLTEYLPGPWRSIGEARP
jgi:hypothetical protein